MSTHVYVREGGGGVVVELGRWRNLDWWSLTIRVETLGSLYNIWSISNLLQKTIKFSIITLIFGFMDKSRTEGKWSFLVPEGEGTWRGLIKRWKSTQWFWSLVTKITTKCLLPWYFNCCLILYVITMSYNKSLITFLPRKVNFLPCRIYYHNNLHKVP